MLVFRSVILSLILSGSYLPAAADDLDAALEAQKQKVSHRIYSEKAKLASPNLTVPRTETEEERLLDKKLREMDAKMDIRPAPTFVPTTTRPIAVTPRPTEDKNWLTAAVLDDLESPAITKEADDSWLFREMDRQKTANDQAELLKEDQMVNRLMKQRTDLQISSPDVNRLKQYQLAPPKLFGSKYQDSPAYLTPQRNVPNTLSSMRQTTTKESTDAPPPFSPAAARLATMPDPNLNGSALSGVPAHQSSSVFSYGRNNPKPTPMAPLEKIRSSSPINRPDPFTDDHMPTFKSSIWE